MASTARKTRTIVATLEGATRRGCSVNGNPDWILHTSEGNFATEIDGQIGYTISNHTGRHDSYIGKRVRFTLIGRGEGRVTDWTLA